MNARSAIGAALLLSLVACKKKEPDLVAKAWVGIHDSPNGCPDDFDYFPGGGMRIFYCHLKTIAAYDAIQKAAGMPIFLSGPHTPTQLLLDQETKFGHYNPEFVRWLK